MVILFIIGWILSGWISYSVFTFLEKKVKSKSFLILCIIGGYASFGALISEILYTLFFNKNKF